MIYNRLPVLALAMMCCLHPFSHLFSQNVNLGAASTFAVFTSSGAFNNTGPTIITGDIGTNAGAFSGFPPGIVNGSVE